jgi:hypothetical protein
MCLQPFRQARIGAPPGLCVLPRPGMSAPAVLTTAKSGYVETPMLLLRPVARFTGDVRARHAPIARGVIIDHR